MNIGIIGSDNSHAIAYSTIANIEKRMGDHRVTMISGDDPVRTQEVASTGQIPEIVSGAEDMVGKIDAAIVVNRHGGLHRNNAIPLLVAGIPVYVDKPFAIETNDCDAMVQAAKSGGTFVTSYSSLRWADQTEELVALQDDLGEIRAAQFAGPCDFSSEYAGPFFYATHVADIMLRFLEDDIETVRASRSGETVAVNVSFAHGVAANILYTNDAAYHFTATLFGTKTYAHREIIAGQDSYAAAMSTFIEAVETGEPPLEEHRLSVPIRFVHALNASLERNGEAVRFQ